MRIETHPHRSQIMEYLFVPKLLLDSSILEDISAKGPALFVQSIQVLEQLVDILSPFKDKVTKHYPWSKGFSLLHTAYFHLLHEGKDPLDLPAFYAELRALSEEELDGIFRSSLSEAGEGKLKEDVWELLEDSYANPKYTGAEVAVCMSVGIDQLFGLEQDLDIDDLANLLKTLSDVTRYQVMAEMVQPHVKSKDVAEKLGITGAAVSFHTQKLVNAQLLLYNTTDKSIKFDANKALLNQLVARLQADFGLDEEV